MVRLEPGLDRGVIQTSVVAVSEGRFQIAGIMSLSSAADATKERHKLFHIQVNTQTLGVENVKSYACEFSTSNKPNSGEVAAYNLSYVHVKKDGGIVLLVERLQSTTKSLWINFSSIYAANFKSDGALNYYVMIPRNQGFLPGPYSTGCSLVALYDDNSAHLRVIYNDKKSNADHVQGPVETMLWIRHSVPVLVTVDNTGRAYKTQLENRTKKDVVICPLWTSQGFIPYEDEAPIAGIAKRGYQIGSISLDAFKVKHAYHFKPIHHLKSTPIRTSIPSNNRYHSNAGDGVIIGFEGGISSPVPSGISSWLNKSGYPVRYNSLNQDLSFQMLLGNRENLLGGELSFSDSHIFGAAPAPDFSKFRIGLTYGKLLASTPQNKTVACLTVGFGQDDINVSPSAYLPVTSQPTDFDFLRNYLYVNPSFRWHVVSHGGKGLSTGVNIGARISIGNSSWFYKDKKTEMSIPGIPAGSSFSVYINIPFLMDIHAFAR
jgi:hypothetical protein